MINRILKKVKGENMKENGNDRRAAPYYLGLDVGTNSVGWAVTDPDYQLLRFHGNAMWGARLFDEAKDASQRRTARTNRRRLARRKQRLLLLEQLFAPEIEDRDPGFFLRLEESGLWLDDKTDRQCAFALFHDPGFTDRDYHRRYPTIYHLRQELMQSTQPHDVRLVYLALHHILKSRGHFLYDTSGDTIQSVEDALRELGTYLDAEYAIALDFQDLAGFLRTLSRSDLGIQAKKRQLLACWGGRDGADDALSISALLALLSGAKVKLAELFQDESLAQSEPPSLSLKSDLDAVFDALSAALGDRIELLLCAKNVFDAARLTRMLDGSDSLSGAKIALYEKNRRDLRLLKAYVRKAAPKKYREIFSVKREKLNNYAAYSGYRSRSGDHSCTQEAFCKYLLAELPKPSESDAELLRMFGELHDGSFLTKLKGSDNGVIPYQLQRQELRQILENAAGYLPFLNERDAAGRTVREKVEMTFSFRIPYYVGPLHPNAGSRWAVRAPGKEREKVYPWNFGELVDTEASAGAFIEQLIGRCSYTGERVLPKDSLLYSEYMLRNEMNPLRVNGKPLPVDVREAMIRDLFQNSRKKVTKKQIRNYLLCRGLIGAEDELSGIDDTVKSTLRSYHDMRRILEKTGDRELVEEIIRHILIFGEDRAMLRNWLRKNCPGLDESDLSYLSRLKYSAWGRLSRTFLTELYSEDPDGESGEAYNILEMLRRTDCNLMQLLTDRYRFAELAEAHRNALFGGRQTLDDRLDSLYLAPAVRRSVRQTLRIVDEIVDIRKGVPSKIFIEMARGSAQEMKGKRTESRKAKLLELYDACRAESAALRPMLEREDDERLRSDKLFLYYSQFGKCMYSGEPIDLEGLMSGHGFDIDHIFPRSRVKDNSLDNRVVVKNVLNREKTNEYPIKREIRTSMRPFWKMLREKGLISEKKYDRLTRATPLTDEELSAFVARQLVETQQSTRALTLLLKERYGELTRIVFSKAGNVSEFRQSFDLLKCREVNDLHHARDAYLNIVVGNVYDTRFTKRFFANIRSEEYSLNHVFDRDVPGAWDSRASIQTVKRVMAKNNPLVTRMPKEVGGELFKLKLKPAGKGQLEKKRGLPVERYGGYNKLTGAYYLVAEHTKRGKRVRSIETVLLYQQKEYEKDPLRYCTDVLGLCEPRIVCSEIRVDTLLELDGSRLYISGRTGNKHVYEHAYQLAIDPEWERYLRKLTKYLDRCAAKRAELPVTEFDGITGEMNRGLYDCFLQKMHAPVYQKLLANMERDLRGSKDAFDRMSLYEQAKTLLEILKAFRSDAQNANLEALCGKGKETAGRITMNKKLSEKKTAYLIHQSVTGLYETREDLLR